VLATDYTDFTDQKQGQKQVISWMKKSPAGKVYQALFVDLLMN